MIPDYDELERMDFQQLVDRLARTSTAELASLDPDTLMDGAWPLLDEQFREEFIANCDGLSDHDWQQCDKLAEKLFAWIETFGGFSHTSVTADRFHLSASLMLKAAPRPGIRLLDPAFLLHDFLSEFPCSSEEARRMVSRWGAQPDIDEFRALANPLSLINQLKRVEHLFAPSEDRTVYHQWEQLRHELFGHGA